MPSDQVHRSERLQGRHVAAASHHDVGLSASVVAGPFPNADAGGAVFDGLVHSQPHRGWLLARDDDVHVVAAAQTVVGNAEKAVGIRREVDADDLGLFVDNMINETRVLVTEAVVILPPDMRTEQVVERGYRAAPGDVAGHFQPFGVLVEHRVNDVYEGLVAAEEAVPARQQVTFEPALALMFGQYFQNTTVRRKMIVFRENLRDITAICDLQYILPAVG